MVFPRRLQQVADRLAAGEFRLGLEDLRRIYNEDAYVDRALMAEFLLRTGDRLKAHKLIQSTLNLPNVTGAIKARLYEHLAYLIKQSQGLEASIQLYEKSLDLAQKANDLEQICRTQLWMMSAKADAHGPDSLGPLPSEIVSNVMKVGNPHIRLFLHTTFAEVEGRRAGFDLARRHIDVAMALLAKHRDLWTEARLSLLCGALHSATSEIKLATSYTLHALELARDSGCSLVESAAICNLGQLCIVAGETEEARIYLQQARHLTREVRSQRYAVIDSLAQIELLDGRLDECQAWIAQLPSDKQEQRWYNDLDNEVTRLRLFQRRRDLTNALSVAESATTAAADRSAHLLHTKYSILRADILVDMGRIEEAHEALLRIGHSITRSSLGNLAEFERVQARIAVRIGSESRAIRRFERAARILTCLGHVSSHRELIDQKTTELMVARKIADETSSSTTDDESPRTSLCESFVSTSRMIALGPKPMLLGLEALELIRQSGSATRIALIVADEGGQVVRSVNWVDDRSNESASRSLRLRFGADYPGGYELLAEPTSRVGAEEVIQSVFDIVSTAVELHTARRERFERTSLWPTEMAMPDAGPMFYSEKMKTLRQQALRMARTDLKVLITGETGVGKEIIAQLIHQASKRAEKRFEAVNCASVPHELFEAHLFGHRKGAFTGAIADSPGVIRANDGGTIFFDEIGELDMNMQVKLLRVIDVRQIQPLGSPHAIPVDFRVIAATNADLQQLMQAKRFRDDLFYRLNVATLRVPPLRERREEILPFLQYFLSLFCAENDKPLPSLSDEAAEYLLLYNWPGNVRELRNEMERVAGLIDPGQPIRPSDLKPEILTARRAKQEAVEAGPNEITVRIDQPLERAYDEIARQAILAALKRNKGNLEATAKDLGITRKGLYNKRLRFGMV